MTIELLIEFLCSFVWWKVVLTRYSSGSTLVRFYIYLDIYIDIYLYIDIDIDMCVCI